MKVFHGICACEGFAIGTVFRLRHTIGAQKRKVGMPHFEISLYENAVAIAIQELTELAEKADDNSGEIFEVQRMMLEDGGLNREIYDYIRVGAGAAAAVERAANIYAQQLEALQDGYLSERSADILDACHRVVEILDGGQRRLESLKHPSIIISENVYPTDIAGIDRNLLLAIVTSQGSPTTHAAIIARNMGIPFIVAAERDFLNAKKSEFAAVDGKSGTLYLSPDEATKARFAQNRQMAQRYSRSLDLLRGKPCKTKDGVRINLFANCISLDDVALAVSMGAEGIALARREAIVLNGSHVMDEQEQFELYSKCVKIADGRPVYVSTYDIIPQDDLTVETGPLGMRGIRYSLANKHVLVQQLKALLCASVYGPLAVAFPMVCTKADVLAAKQIIEQTKQILIDEGKNFSQNLQIGIVVETPAAALEADTLAKLVDFFLIGTNDLAQYTMAADRSLSSLQNYLRMPNRPVMKLIEMIAKAANDASIQICVCGESATDTPCILSCARLGIQTFSVGPRRLLEVKAELLEESVRN